MPTVDQSIAQAIIEHLSLRPPAQPSLFPQPFLGYNVGLGSVFPDTVIPPNMDDAERASTTMVDPVIATTLALTLPTKLCLVQFYASANSGASDITIRYRFTSLGGTSVTLFNHRASNTTTFFEALLSTAEDLIGPPPPRGSANITVDGAGGVVGNYTVGINALPIRFSNPSRQVIP